MLLLRKKKPVLPEEEDSAAAAKAAAFFCLQTVVLDGGLTTADVEGVVAEEEGSPICDITVDDSVEADDKEPDCTEEAVVFEPLFLTFAWPEVSSGKGNSCGCCGGSGGNTQSRLAGGSGRNEQGLGVGGFNPCISVLISSLRVVFLYHLRRVALLIGYNARVVPSSTDCTVEYTWSYGIVFW